LELFEANKAGKEAHHRSWTLEANQSANCSEGEDDGLPTPTGVVCTALFNGVDDDDVNVDVSGVDDVDVDEMGVGLIRGATPLRSGVGEVVGGVPTPFGCDCDVLEALLFNPPTTPPTMMATMATNATTIMMIPLLVR